MDPRTRVKYGEISKLILKLIATGALTSLAGFSGSPTKTNQAVNDLLKYSEKQIKRSLIYLRLQGYVRYSAEDEKSPFLITHKGLNRLNTRTVKDKLLGLVQKRWDHLWRIVAFDVPETKKYYRDKFTKSLRASGFFPFQKSIYVTPYDCRKCVRQLARRCRILRYVVVSVTPDLGWREHYAIDWFKIKNHI